MAKPTLAEAIANAIALGDENLSAAVPYAQTIEDVESMMENTGFSSYEIEQVTQVDPVEMEKRVATATAEAISEEEAADEDEKFAIKRVTIGDVFNAIIGRGHLWDVDDDSEYQRPEGEMQYEDIGGLGGSGESIEGQARSEQRLRLTAPADVLAAVDALLLDDTTSLTRREIINLLLEKDSDAVYERAREVLQDRKADTSQIQNLEDMFPSGTALERTTPGGSTVGGDGASKEAIKERFDYEGDFAENHDFLIGQGWYIQIDPDDNIFYINPTDRTTQDSEGNYVGMWHELTGVIKFLERADTRAPIGMATGTYGTGVDTSNLVPYERVPLQDWYDLYGNEFVDIVDNRDWEAVLKNELGVQGWGSYYAMLLSQATKGAGPSADIMLEGLETELHYQYLEGEQVNMFIDMPMEEMVSYQKMYEQLEGVGYKIAKEGRFDPMFIDITNKIMYQANLDKEGDPKGFETVLQEMLDDGSYASILGGRRSGGTSRVWRPPAYLAPDYAELSQAVKMTFEQKMGRAPSDAEIMLMSKKMQVDHRGEFDAQVTAQKLQFFNQGGDSAGTVQDTNYAARFQENFESRYGAELGTLDKIEQSRSITQSALGSILAADRAIGY